MHDDLRDLLSAWLGGDLDADRAAQLMCRLRADEAFRREFVAETQMLSMLKAVQSAEPRWLQLEDELGLGDPMPADEPLEDRVLQAIEAQPRRRATVWPWAILASALLAATLVIWRSHPSAERAPVGTVVELPVPVAVLVKADDVQWDASDGQRPAVGTTLRPGRLRLRTGQVTINFVNGVVLSLQGPAELDIASADRVFCRRGKLRTRVPPGAEGFTVLAPGSAVVDLGTEFALNVGDDGKAEVMVFEGRASISVLNSAGHTISSEECRERSAVEVDPGAGRIRDAVAEPTRFVSAVRLIPPTLSLDSAYTAAVREARPWSYWRFGTREDGTVANEIPGRPSLRVSGSVRRVGTPEVGVAAFDPGQSDQYLVTDGTWTPPRATGYAIELWALSQGFNHSTLVSMIPETAAPNEGHVALVEFTGRSRALVHEECAIRYLDRWPVSRTGGANVFTRAMYTPNRWHHLVAQLAHGDVELYVDGHLVGVEPSRSAPETTACRLLLGRMKPERDNDPQQVRALVGRIAELAVYDQPLPADQIRRHAGYRKP